MVDWTRLVETRDVSIRLPVPSKALGIALFVPAAAYLLHRLTTLPRPKNHVKVSPGLASVPPGTLKTRIDELYPPNLLGEALYADLPYGKTKFTLLGPEDGRKIVLIHGFSIPSIIFNDVADRLASAGFRVLTYDLYGRGYSDTPHEINLPIYVTQLALLLQHVSWQKTRVVGLSMGGAIAAAFSIQFPNLVDGAVALVASAGNFPDGFSGRIAPFLTLPIFTRTGILRFIQSFKSLPPPPQSRAQTNEQVVFAQRMALPRYTHTLASTLRFGPLRGIGPLFKKIGQSDLRVLILHGTGDEIVPYHPFAVPILTDYIPQAKLVTLENLGHGLVGTHPDEVAKGLIDFFNGV